MAIHSGVIDSGAYFEIVPTTRKVMVPPAYKVIGTVGDHKSEQLTFKCPIMIDGYNVMECSEHYVTWKNVNGDKGSDELQNITAAEDGENFYFTWTVRDKLAAAYGLVSFSLHFEDEENGVLAYRWSTASCTECEILDSINAAVATYAAVYVSGDTLVFADYVLVTDDGTVEINTIMVPEGKIDITANGTYDIGEYATAEVAVLDDPNLVPENIKSGVSIFGVTGTFDTVRDNFRNVNGILGETLSQLDAFYQRLEKDGNNYYLSTPESYLNYSANQIGTYTGNSELPEALLGGLIIIKPKQAKGENGHIYNGFRLDKTKSKGVTEVYKWTEVETDRYTYTNLLILKVIEDNFEIHFTFAG